MIQNMASIKKAKVLNTDLNMLDEKERDHIEELAKSLLAVQNASNAAVGTEELHTEATRKEKNEKREERKEGNEKREEGNELQ